MSQLVIMSLFFQMDIELECGVTGYVDDQILVGI